MAKNAPVISGNGDAAYVTNGALKAAPSQARKEARRLAPLASASRNTSSSAAAPSRLVVISAPRRPATA